MNNQSRTIMYTNDEERATDDGLLDLEINTAIAFSLADAVCSDLD